MEGRGFLLNCLCRILAKTGPCKDEHRSSKVEFEKRTQKNLTKIWSKRDFVSNILIAQGLLLILSVALY